jgi:hypothetical protein
MNNQLREFERTSGLDIYGLGARRDKWEAALTKYAELIVQECVRYFNEDYVRDFDVLWREDLSKGMKEHFGVKE